LSDAKNFIHDLIRNFKASVDSLKVEFELVEENLNKIRAHILTLCNASNMELAMALLVTSLRDMCENHYS
jgi:hypothetical protein